MKAQQISAKRTPQDQIVVLDLLTASDEGLLLLLVGPQRWFLSDRSQFVHVDNEASEFHTLVVVPAHVGGDTAVL